MKMNKEKSTLLLIKKCLEKQIPKKPVTDEWDVVWLCPACTSALWLEQRYCGFCGQFLEWDD